MFDFIFKCNILTIFDMAPANKSNKAMLKATSSISHHRARTKYFVIRGEKRRRFRISKGQGTTKGLQISGPEGTALGERRRT